MSVEQARGLLKKVAEDPEFRARLESAPVDQKRAILAEVGYGDVRLRHLSEALPVSAGGEIPDDELEEVAGGVGTITLVSRGASAAVSDIAAAVAAV